MRELIRIGESLDAMTPPGKIVASGHDGIMVECRSPAEPTDWLECLVSWGGHWDHVSVKARDSKGTRTPTWDEMCFIKDLFFQSQETAMQLHPPKSEYVNVHPHVLHIWKPQSKSIPRPPKEFV